MASSYKQILDLGLLMDLVLSNRSGLKVRTQKPRGLASLVSDGSNSHELRTKGRMYLPPSPAITAHPPLFLKKSCLQAVFCVLFLTQPPLGFISSLEFLFSLEDSIEVGRKKNENEKKLKGHNPINKKEVNKRG